MLLIQNPSVVSSKLLGFLCKVRGKALNRQGLLRVWVWDPQKKRGMKENSQFTGKNNVKHCVIIYYRCPD